MAKGKKSRLDYKGVAIVVAALGFSLNALFSGMEAFRIGGEWMHLQEFACPNYIGRSVEDCVNIGRYRCGFPPIDEDNDNNE